MLQIRTSRLGDFSPAAALADEVSASLSFFTLKTNQKAENGVFFLCHCCAQSLSLLLLISFQQLLLFIYEIEIKVSTQFLFARRLSVIAFLSAACVPHTLLYLPFKISLCWVES